MTWCCGSSKEGGSEYMLREAIKESMTTGDFPAKNILTNIPYARYLERQNEYLHAVYFQRSTEIARLQSYIKQIIQAPPDKRNQLINQLKQKPFKPIGFVSHRYSMFPTLEQHNAAMGDIKARRQLFMQRVRQQIGSLRKAIKNLPTECWMSKVKETESKASLASQMPADYGMICRIITTETTNNNDSDISCTNIANDSRNSLRGSVISARSSSFKELRDMYENNSADVLKLT